MQPGSRAARLFLFYLTVVRGGSILTHRFRQRRMPMAEKKLTGKIARERIRSMETPLSPEGIIEGFRALGNASGIVSDVMDELSITGIIGASVLKPTIPGSCVVGPALTVRNIMQRDHVYENSAPAREQDGRIRGPQPGSTRRCRGHRRGGRYLEHGWHLGANGQAPRRGWRHGIRRDPRCRSLPPARISNLGHRGNTRYRQMAHRDRRDQWGDSHCWHSGRRR